ncbi:ABC transporter ATP-binding protein [Candidatus Roizmanbacteria bacterium RIFCSPLOWO2_02_FULL_38_10]|uniref:ABC transporter ATP-binding protein n=1 Tax=Candidatus Roizmanbacteria bacterium RIFCSPLOWO2_02_FULL_38_10 TaxID=1802074 RepID=A0A1F7JNZ0_9BACT|nr:MAG: ABC transporter ATP-binding protein [Candidatus Roizmanbacteria bacterium RIFCSPLOWO2_02_FULL_38_10]
MGKAIVVKNLVKKYKKSNVFAVDNISFEVAEGEFFAFLGPNGAGKTTTISILTTTLAKTSGKVTIAGYDLDREEAKVRQNIGIIFQKPSLDNNLTAEENIRYHAFLYNVYPYRPTFSLMPRSYKAKVSELSKILNIEKDIFRPIKTYSGGMKRKLEIVRSLIHHPKILFLDEPTSGLDPQSRKTLWQYLHGMKQKSKMTIFLTTHYLEEAEDADNINIINHGKIIESGTPLEIKKDILKQHLIIDADNRNELIQELKDKKIPYQLKDHITLPFKESTPHQLIKKIQTPLSYLSIYQPSLEEAYLDIIGQNEQGN